MMNAMFKGGNAACFKIAAPLNCKIESSFKLLLLYIILNILFFQMSSLWIV